MRERECVDQDENHTLRDSVEVFRTALPTQTINLSLPSAPVPVVVDPVRLTQTLNAGLVWCINRTRSGSTLEVELALQPSSDPSQEEARVCVRVRQGAAVRCEELFATLQQLDDRLRVVPGALLSLRTARKMAAAVGGSLAALDGRGDAGAPAGWGHEGAAARGRASHCDRALRGR